MEEFQNVLGFITAIRYLLLRHPLLLVPSPGLSSPSSDVSCSNLLEACPSDSRGFASFPCDFACSYIPVSDIPLFHGPKFCNNDTISNSVCFSSRPVRFPTTRSIARRGVYIGRFTRITPTAIVSVTSPFFLFTSSKWNSGLRGVSRASYDVYDGIVRVFAPGL